MNHHEEFILFVHSYPLFEQMKKKLLDMRPMIPSHSPDDDNTELWKSLSAQQKGFDLCCQFFQILSD